MPDRLVKWQAFPEKEANSRCVDQSAGQNEIKGRGRKLGEHLLAEDDAGPGNAEVDRDRGQPKIAGTEMQKRNACERSAPDPGEKPAGVRSGIFDIYGSLS